MNADAFAAGLTVSVPLARINPVAVRPEIVPPSLYAFAEQVTFTEVASLAPIVAEPEPTLQVAPCGCAWTPTA